MHTFRKYISNRGSALFMVISTMTALMITCMAMYFTVLASRSTIYAVFNQKQSYQNSSSIYDMVVNNGLSPTSDLYKQMEKMAVGDTLTTPPTEDQYLGTYTVTITKLSENEYDIIVSSTVDGVTETVHNVISITNSVEEVPLDGGSNVSIAPTFAATGYVPNDVYLDKGHFRSDVFFDNEVTYFGAYAPSELFACGDISCGGSVVMTQGKNMTLADGGYPITFSVRNNLTIPALGRELKFVEGSKILVGGNLYLSDKFVNVDVYVNGDVYFSGSPNFDPSVRYFINGNIYFDVNNGQTPQNVYCNGTVYGSNGSERTDISRGKWDYVDSVTGNWEGVAGPGDESMDLNGKTVLSYNKMIKELDGRTQTNTYYKWTVKDSKISKNGTINKQEIVVEDRDKPAEIVYGSEKWGIGCDVTNITVKRDRAAFIIIDTGDDPDNVYTMRLEANRTGPDGKKNLFSWTGEMGDRVNMRVLIKGKGSVVFDIPKGVTYQDTDYIIVAHYNWWILSGGRDPGWYDTGDTSSNTHLLGPSLGDYVHNCKDNDCKNVTISDVTNGERCTREVAYEVNGVIQHKICNELKQVATCPEHGISLTFCPKCEMSYVKDLAGNYIICKDHVDVTAVQNAYNNAPNNGLPPKEEWNTIGDDVVIPTTNIYFVSCDESASFNFGYHTDGTTFVDHNTTTGYVYAPYITFVANSGTTGGDAIKFMGGMTVSDYNFYSDQTFIMCVPDKNPTELMDPDDLKQKFKVSKDWKIDLVTH